MKRCLIRIPSNLLLFIAIRYLTAIQSDQGGVLALLCLRSGGGLEIDFAVGLRGVFLLAVDADSASAPGWAWSVGCFVSGGSCKLPNLGIEDMSTVVRLRSVVHTGRTANSTLEELEVPAGTGRGHIEDEVRKIDAYWRNASESGSTERSAATI